MSMQYLNLGSTANDDTGDKLRDGGVKINANFAELDTRATAAQAAAVAAQAAASAAQVTAGAAIPAAQMGVANGVATLDATGRVPAAELPSYVDDVLEFPTLTALPATGETGKIYVVLDTNFEYRWSGTGYIKLVASPGSTDALAEGSVSLYFTTARVLLTALAGIAFTDSSLLTAADNIKVAFGKLQAQLSALVTAIAGKAAKGANNDITSLSGLTTGIVVAQGGTGAATADTARANLLVPGKNLLINGRFDIWQRALGQTINGYGSADRWFSYSTGSTKTTSQQAFAIGQIAVPDNPTFFLRTVVASVVAAGNFVIASQYMEDVTRLSGKTITVSFWAKADASKSIGIELNQSFGSGGSPSAIVTTIGSQLFALTTSWQKFTATITLPSVSGKTLGTTANTSYTGLIFWLDAGSSFAARSGGLGQQSGTFDIANVKIEIGSAATGWDGKSAADEMISSQRYYQTKSLGLRVTAASAGSLWIAPFTLSQVLRGTPVIAVISIRTQSNLGAADDIGMETLDSGYIQIHPSAAGDALSLGVLTSFDAEIQP